MKNSTRYLGLALLLIVAVVGASLAVAGDGQSCDKAKAEQAAAKGTCADQAAATACSKTAAEQAACKAACANMTDAEKAACRV